MDQEQQAKLWLMLGEIKGAIEELVGRADRHNAVHAGLESTVQANKTAIEVIKGKSCLIAAIVSFAIGAGGLLIFFYGTGILNK